MRSAAFLIVPLMLIACQSGQHSQLPIDLAVTVLAITRRTWGVMPPPLRCVQIHHANPWALPLTKATMGASFRVTLRDTAPTMPQIGMNLWLLDVADSNGKAAPGH